MTDDDKAKPIDIFRLSDSDLRQDDETYAAHIECRDKRKAYGSALKELNAAIEAVRSYLEEPMRGMIPSGKHWTFEEDDEPGLIIKVWEESKKRGKKKVEIPTKKLSLGKPRPTETVQTTFRVKPAAKPAPVAKPAITLQVPAKPAKPL